MDGDTLKSPEEEAITILGIGGFDFLNFSPVEELEEEEEDKLLSDSLEELSLCMVLNVFDFMVPGKLEEVNTTDFGVKVAGFITVLVGDAVCDLVFGENVAGRRITLEGDWAREFKFCAVLAAGSCKSLDAGWNEVVDFIFCAVSSVKLLVKDGLQGFALENDGRLYEFDFKSFSLAGFKIGSCLIVISLRDSVLFGLELGLNNVGNSSSSSTTKVCDFPFVLDFLSFA